MVAKEHKLSIDRGLACHTFLSLLLIAGCARDDGGQGDLSNSKSVVEPDAAVFYPGEYSALGEPFSIDHDDLALGQDAVRLLTDAQAEALKSHRNVMLQFSGPRCPPCRAMSLALASVSRQLEKDFVYVQIDRRMYNFGEVYSAYSRNVSSVPYVCFLSPTGQVLAGGTVNGKNIGFPSTPAAVEHFRQMLETTSKRLTTKEIEQVLSAFKLAGNS